MSDFKKWNSYDWTKHHVDERKKLPAGKHFQVHVYETRQEYSPPYDSGDPGTYNPVNVVTVYAMTTEEELKRFIEGATVSGMVFAFFEVQSIGKATINVNVKVS